MKPSRAIFTVLCCAAVIGALGAFWFFISGGGGFAASGASAAVFDSLLPAANSLRLGTAVSPWLSISKILYFSNSNVGIGNFEPPAAPPGKDIACVGCSVLEIPGGVRINTVVPTAIARPTCTAGTRGMLWITVVAGVDQLNICLRTGASTYGWRQPPYIGTQ